MKQQANMAIEPTVPSGWLPAAVRLWRQNRRVEAIQACVAQVNAEGGFHRPALSMQIAYYLFLSGDFRAGSEVLAARLAVTPDHEEARLALGVMQSRLGRNAEAAEAFGKVLALNPDNAVAYDGLAASLWALRRSDEARAAGAQALLLKDRQACVRAGARAPAASLAATPILAGKRVIAFSLWGADARYLRGALRNALLVPDLYPGWRARFYLDATVPAEFRAALLGLDAEVVVEPAGQALRQKLLWRMKVANDASVSHYLIRDADAVINQRERRAVDEWLISGRRFHVMRDWWTHTDLMLAGLWGGLGGLLPPLAPLLERYRQPHAETANIDQWFLRDEVWPLVKPSCLVHDRLYRVLDSRPFPDPDPPGTFHVGQNEYVAAPTAQARRLGAWIETLPCLRVGG